jgi:hypothetical protein
MIRSDRPLDNLTRDMSYTFAPPRSCPYCKRVLSGGRDLYGRDALVCTNSGCPGKDRPGHERL